jgi:branched-chain amino acid transport system ATP-binding protein
MTMLKTNAITMQFGGLTAVKDLNLEINKGEIVAVIGPNGAGKTTAFNMITGVYKPTSGTVQLMDKTITGLKPNKITSLGMARTFQNIRLFKDLSVEDNIFIAQHLHLKSNLYQAMFRMPGYQREEKAILEKYTCCLTV